MSEHPAYPESYAFPEATTLDDLFEFVDLTTPNAYRTTTPVVWKARDALHEDWNLDINVGPYFSTHARNGTYKVGAVRPNARVMEYISQNMLPLKNDTLYFEAVETEGGRWLILVRYNVILGSRWLALLSAEAMRATKIPADIVAGLTRVEESNPVDRGPVVEPAPIGQIRRRT